MWKFQLAEFKSITTVNDRCALRNGGLQIAKYVGPTGAYFEPCSKGVCRVLLALLKKASQTCATHKVTLGTLMLKSFFQWVDDDRFISFFLTAQERAFNKNTYGLPEKKV